MYAFQAMYAKALEKYICSQREFTPTCHHGLIDTNITLISNETSPNDRAYLGIAQFLTTMGNVDCWFTLYQH